jgi:hypothetical protein
MAKICLMIALLSILLSVLLTGCISTSISEKEKTLLLTVEDFGEYGVDYSEDYLGEYSKKYYTDVSSEIKYRYDPSEDSSATPFYLVSSIEFDRSESDARESYSLGILAYQGGSFLGGADIEEAKGFISLGDETYFASVKNDNATLGNIISVRRGNRIYSLIIGGMYIDDPEVLEELLSDRLSAMESFK